MTGKIEVRTIFMFDLSVPLQIIIITAIASALIIPPLYLWNNRRMHVLMFFAKLNAVVVFLVTFICINIYIDIARIPGEEESVSAAALLLMIYFASVYWFIRLRRSFVQDIEAYKQSNPDIYNNAPLNKNLWLSIVVGVLISLLYMI